MNLWNTDNGKHVWVITYIFDSHHAYLNVDFIDDKLRWRRASAITFSCDRYEHKFRKKLSIYFTMSVTPPQLAGDWLTTPTQISMCWSRTGDLRSCLARCRLIRRAGVSIKPTRGGFPAIVYFVWLIGLQRWLEVWQFKISVSFVDRHFWGKFEENKCLKNNRHFLSTFCWYNRHFVKIIANGYNVDWQREHCLYVAVAVTCLPSVLLCCIGSNIYPICTFMLQWQ